MMFMSIMIALAEERSESKCLNSLVNELDCEPKYVSQLLPDCTIQEEVERTHLYILDRAMVGDVYQSSVGGVLTLPGKVPARPSSQ